MARSLCKVEGCLKTINGLGLCPKHYWRLKTHGTLELKPRPVCATEDNFWEYVDRENGPWSDLLNSRCWIWIGPLYPNGYGRVGRKYSHKVSYEIANGPCDSGIQVDHICHNKSCVRLEHLRPATNKQNMENQGLRASNTSGYRGVHWSEKVQKWQARVTHNYHRYNLGFFDSPEEANAAAVAARNELYTHNILDRVNA